MATKIGSTVNVTAQDVFTSSTVQQHDLGTKAYSADGRTFRYVKVGASALIPGNFLQSPAVVANHVNLVTTNPSAGDATITVTLGATAVTANQYAGGVIVIEKGSTGAGQTLLIKSHPAASGSASLVVTLEDAVVTTVTGTATSSLIANNYNGVIQTPVTTLTGICVGVAVAPLAASSFGWICSRGLTGALADGIITVGTVGVAVPSAAAGAAKVMAATLAQVGVFQKTTIDAQITPCFVTID